MANKEDKSLIGFDPLAWMNDETLESNQLTNSSETQQVVDEDKAEIGINAEVEEQTESSMDSTTHKNEEVANDSKITLDATLNIQNVSALYECLLKRLKSQNTIEIDASAVTTIDTSSLQLLIILKQTAVKLHKEVIIDFPSDNFIEAAKLLGLAEMLDVEVPAAGLF